jgi:hypothetical protein
MTKKHLTTTFAALKTAGACNSGYRKLAKSLGGVTDAPISLIQILDSNGVDDCLWALRAVDHPEINRIARLIACDCAESVLHLYESQYPDDSRPRTAISVARRFANGEATADELEAARAADAAARAADAAAWAAGAADAAARAARAAGAAGAMIKEDQGFN